MQWSGSAPSRYAPPSELFFLPVIALAVSIFLWTITPTDKARNARLGLTIGNGVNGVLNASAVTLLAGQLGGGLRPARYRSAPSLSLSWSEWWLRSQRSSGRGQGSNSS